MTLGGLPNARSLELNPSYTWRKMRRFSGVVRSKAENRHGSKRYFGAGGGLHPAGSIPHFCSGGEVPGEPFADACGLSRKLRTAVSATFTDAAVQRQNLWLGLAEGKLIIDKGADRKFL